MGYPTRALGGGCRGCTGGKTTHRALGATPPGGSFTPGPGQGCAEGSHAVQIAGTDEWLCVADETDIGVPFQNANGDVMVCQPGYLPQEIPTGSGNWVCVAGVQGSASAPPVVTVSTSPIDGHTTIVSSSVADTFTSLTPKGAPATTAPTVLNPAPAGDPSAMVSDQLPDNAVYDAIDAVTNAGGDPSMPTKIINADDNSTVAVVRQLPNGSIHVAPPDSPNVDLGSVVQSVTGFIDTVAGGLQTVGTEVQKVGNAVKGAAAGAQAGYHAPTSWTPFLLGGALLGGALLLSKR